MMEIISNNIVAYIKCSPSKPKTIIRTEKKHHFDVFKIISHWFEAAQVENLAHRKEGNGMWGELFCLLTTQSERIYSLHQMVFCYNYSISKLSPLDFVTVLGIKEI